MECIKCPRRAVPNCVINVCPQGLPVIDGKTFEPLPCSSNRQCISADIPSICYISHSSSGYCCRISEKSLDMRKTSKLGLCPHSVNSPADCRKNEIDNCVEDIDCDAVQKCCSNGCKKLCMYPEITTGVACIHLLGTSKAFEPGSFVPQCDESSDFTRIQNYEKNHNGFDQCCCRDPCKNVQCPSTHVCRLIDIKCLFGKSCHPIPKCVLNVYPKGEPLTLSNVRKLVLCNTKEDHHCPLEYFCQQTEDSSAVCPTEFGLRSTDSKLCKIRCRTHKDCLSGKCCFNGCGTSCTDLRAEEVDRNTVLGFSKGVFSRACIHKLTSYNNANKKIFSNGSRIEYYENGTFKEIQCDQQNRQCRCVNTKTDEEMFGTRVMVAITKPNCQTPIACSTVYDEMKCEHDPQLDTSGCPLNGFCECKNPSEEIKCAREGDVCVLMPVICIISSCPSVPQCKSNPCPKYSKALRDKNNNVFSCVQNDDCNRGSVNYCRMSENMEFTVLQIAVWNVPMIQHVLECNYAVTMVVAKFVSFQKLQRIVFYCTLPSPNLSIRALLSICKYLGVTNIRCVNAVTGAVIHGSRSSRMKLLDSSLAFPYSVCSSETNPCSDTRKPALDEITYIHLSCFENRTEMCPTEPVMMWPCKELATLELVCFETKVKSNLGSCPQGNPFSNKVDGWPVNCTQFGNNCPSTHYCSSAPDQSFGVCYVSKRYVCRLPLDAGPCAVNLKRYYYDYTNKTCISFNYAGCSGNSNNFINKKDCEKFCLDISADLNGLLNSTDKVVEIYQLGFPSRDLCFMANINKIAFRHYLKKRFDVADDELRDIIIYDENVVQFVLRSEDAKLKAANISDLANDGSFRFTYNDNIYRTEPHSCSSHRIAEKKALCGKLLYGKRFVKKVNHHREAFLPLSMQSALAVQHRPSRQALRAMASKNGQCYRQTMSKGSDLYKVHTALQTPGGCQRYRTIIYY
ncbi:hypothetical protein LOAG_02526 [Loa loa]|uniref:BPTI/Kunitz inhibitor domain-containing protein n=1 Tax=Loa loa TaxID=7209 RepID=A0A1S0U6G9_LOALO|nr:hypothetical protein LOAG_02526 [Loa loa]EFO25956.2 hypothetical protein LOAG_02526 [Loa loa]